MTILVLYEELAAYFVKCISTFADQYNVHVHIIHKEINNDAPFKINFGSIQTYKCSEYTDDQLIDLAKKINPDAVFCGGWKSRIYLKIVYEYKDKIPTIIGFDNQWKGNLKQWIACLISPFKILNRFSHCWVPGNKQYEYAVRLGFTKTQIATGAYCCDFDLFHNQYLDNKKSKQNQFPKRFIYIGRYVEHKGIKDLWKAFIDLQNQHPNDWELWCLGTGNIEPIKHPKIKHVGFVQPNNLDKYIKQTGVFVLPSHFEPWGVVVHEFAAAGFPIVCSDEVGAGTTFVQHEINGYIFKSGDIPDLKNQLKRIMDLNDQDLLFMGEMSAEKAQQNTPVIWAEKLMQLVKK